MDNSTTTAKSTSSTAAAPIPPFYIGLAYGVESFELLLHPVVLLVAVLNVRVLSDSRFLHPNLRFILLCQSVAVLCYELQRIGCVWQKFLSGDIFNQGHIVFQVSHFLKFVFVVSNFL
jgi:hypothetical protein